MKTNNRHFGAVLRAVAILASIISLSGCNAADTGKYQDIPVTSEPSGAKVTADTGETITTPGSFYLTRDKRHTLIAKYPGCKSQEITLRSVPQGWTLGNAATGGLLDFVVQSGEGSSKELTPNNVHFNFVKPEDQNSLEVKPQPQTESPQDANENAAKPVSQLAPEAETQIQAETPNQARDTFIKPFPTVTYNSEPQAAPETPIVTNDNPATPAAQIASEVPEQIQADTPKQASDTFIKPFPTVACNSEPQIETETPQAANDNLVKTAGQTDLEAKTQVQSATLNIGDANLEKPVAQNKIDAKPQVQNKKPKAGNDLIIRPVKQIDLNARPQAQNKAMQNSSKQFKSETPQDPDCDIDFTPVCSICGKNLTKEDGIKIYKLKRVCPKCFSKVAK